MFESSSTSQSSRIMRTKFGKFRVIVSFAIKSLTAGAIFLRKKEKSSRRWENIISNEKKKKKTRSHLVSSFELFSPRPRAKNVRLSRSRSSLAISFTIDRTEIRE